VSPTLPIIPAPFAAAVADEVQYGTATAMMAAAVASAGATGGADAGRVISVLLIAGACAAPVSSDVDASADALPFPFHPIPSVKFGPSAGQFYRASFALNFAVIVVYIATRMVLGFFALRGQMPRSDPPLRSALAVRLPSEVAAAERAAALREFLQRPNGLSEKSTGSQGVVGANPHAPGRLAWLQLVAWYGRLPAAAWGGVSLVLTAMFTSGTTLLGIAGGPYAGDVVGVGIAFALFTSFFCFTVAVYYRAIVTSGVLFTTPAVLEEPPVGRAHRAWARGLLIAPFLTWWSTPQRVWIEDTAGEDGSVADWALRVPSKLAPPMQLPPHAPHLKLVGERQHAAKQAAPRAALGASTPWRGEDATRCVELLSAVERADALPALPAPPPPAPSPFAAAPTLLRFGILIQKKVGPVRCPVDEVLDADTEMASIVRADDGSFDMAMDCDAATAMLHICSPSHMSVQTRTNRGASSVSSPPAVPSIPRRLPPAGRQRQPDDAQPAVWRQYAAPFTPFVSFLCAAASGIITGLVRTSPETYCPASTIVSVVLHAVAFAVALIVRPSIFAYENFVAVVSDAFTLGAAVCTLMLAHADTTDASGDRGAALKAAVQVMGVIATVVSTSGAVLSLMRAACMALGQVKAVPLAQYLRDVDARIEWFLLADMEGEGDIWI
jgi:hypothetical protein